MRICTDLGLKDVQDYAHKLKKAEKARELKQQVNLTNKRFKAIAGFKMNTCKLAKCK